MKLFGSLTSPYVRRLRLLMENIDYEFININITEGEGRKILQKISPIGKIPVLQNEPEIIYDSRQIFEYLCESSVHPRLSLEDKNILTIIDGINDSFINLYQLQKSNIKVPKDSQYGIFNYERIELSFKELDQLATKGVFKNWDYLSMSLYSLLDWINFRNLYEMAPYKEINKAMSLFKDDDIVKETAPKIN